MDRIELAGTKRLRGEFTPPADKSVSHRAVMFSSLARGTSEVANILRAKDVESTMNAFRALGVDIEDDGHLIRIHGRGLAGLAEPGDVIDCGNSGTTIRLLSGILAGNPFFSILSGDDSLRLRPMARVINPLGLMGARISARSGNRYPPLAIQGGGLRPVSYEMPVASAQVKSCILLAGLYAEGETSITEPSRSRDHTERMLPAFGARVETDGLTVRIRGGGALSAQSITVPGDFSSAAFFLVAALLFPGAEVTARNVGLNETRTGLLNVLEAMGAKVWKDNLREVSGEPVGDLMCRGEGRLRAVDVTAEMIPSLIDELPILCVASALAEGTTRISGAAELRFKESDRIAAMARELGKMGVQIEELPDGLIIQGMESLGAAEVESHGDHRIAMSMAIAALAAGGRTVIRDASAVDISFPDFFDILRRLTE